jgi:hypothetical protein
MLKFVRILWVLALALPSGARSADAPNAIDAVKTSAPSAVASEAFKARLVAAAGRRHRRKRRIAVGALGGLTVALAAVLIATPIVRDWRAMAVLVGDHVGVTVTREEAFDVAGSDAGTLERWFTGKINFPLHLPQIRDAKLVGARLCDVLGRQIPRLVRARNAQSLHVRRANRRRSSPDGLR